MNKEDAEQRPRRSTKFVEAYKTGQDLHQRTADLIGTTRDAAKDINSVSSMASERWSLEETGDQVRRGGTVHRGVLSRVPEDRTVS